MSEIELSHVVVAGGAGFIGSAFARNYLARHPQARVTVLDKLTYAGNPRNLDPVRDDPRFAFVQADIADDDAVGAALDRRGRRRQLRRRDARRPLHPRPGRLRAHQPPGPEHPPAGGERLGRRPACGASCRSRTDEVYGHVGEGASTEEAPLQPRNPYSASKAGGDLLAFSYHTNFGLPVLVTRGANTIGPYQYPEKATPLFVTNALDDQPLPVYGQTAGPRHYLYVDDHAAAVDLVLAAGDAGGGLQRGRPGRGQHRAAGHAHPRPAGQAPQPDPLRPRPPRPRLPLQPGQRPKLEALGWRRASDWERTISTTVRWYAEHQDWWRPLKSGAYQEYYKRQYGARLGAAGGPEAGPESGRNREPVPSSGHRKAEAA